MRSKLKNPDMQHRKREDHWGMANLPVMTLFSLSRKTIPILFSPCWGESQDF
jgi:hypothetical protein